MNHQLPYMTGNSLTSEMTASFPRQTLLYVVSYSDELEEKHLFNKVSLHGTDALLLDPHSSTTFRMAVDLKEHSSNSQQFYPDLYLLRHSAV
jgi:hypothetical protein